MEDFVFHVAIGVKNDALTQEAGQPALRLMIQTLIENAVLNVPWVTDMLVSEGGEES
jgi:hypothetical protein